MTKILLVEDDNNLREIFEMRLQADGYNTVTAGDGEEALTIAVKEKPDLIIADVMMPKLSGFEMLENLRAVPELADTKVIMMTALGQAEDRARGEKLGVVKYLVKSQVTLEDFVRVVREVLQPAQAQAANPAPGANNPVQSSTSTNKESELSMPPQDTTPPAGATPADPAAPAPSGDAAASGQMSAAEEQANVQSQVNDFAASTPAADPAAPAADPTAPAADPAAPPTSAPGGDPTTPPAPAGGEQPGASASSGL